MRPPQTLRASPPPGSSRLSSLQLSAEAAAPSSASSAASAAEPLPAARGGGCGTTFSRRRGSAGACAPPGPTGGPCPGCRPPRSPRCGRVRAPFPALGGVGGRRPVSFRRGRHPWVRASVSPRGRAGGAGGGWSRRGSGALPAAGAKTLPGHRVTAGPAPLRGGWAPGDPA